MTEYQRLRENLQKLRLTKIDEYLPGYVDSGRGEGKPLVTALRELTDEEIRFRDERAADMNFKLSNFPGRKTFDDFDFAYQPSVDRARIMDLRTLSRRREFLDDFFSSKRQEELDGVRYFVSDMYDAYAAVKRVYFPKAIHIVDFFHVAALLTNAVGKLRVNAMNALEKGSPEYAFMKSKWRLFLCRRSKVPDKTITRRNGEVEHYDDLLFRCVRSTRNLWDGYDILQELLSYREYDTFTEAIAFVERISGRLQSCPSELLKTVGRSYWHWRVEIASGLARNQSGEHFSNGVAEGLNNQIKTIKKLANGYDNFGRFRKRVLLALTYSKKP
jgi:transposase